MQATIERAEQQHQEIVDIHLESDGPANVTSILPQATDRYRKRIAEGLDGNPRVALEAPVILRICWVGFGWRLERTEAFGPNMPCNPRQS